MAKDLTKEKTTDIIDDVEEIIVRSRDVAYQAVNVSLVYRNWLIGKRIFDEELKETRKENYGLEIIKSLSKKLKIKHGNGFSTANLYQFYLFYKTYTDLFQTLLEKSFSLLSREDQNILWPPATQSFLLNVEYSHHILNWTCYSRLIFVSDCKAREWYEKECIAQNWSTKTLRRNIATQYYYRMLESNSHLPRKEDQSNPYERKLEFIKNPVIFEYLEMSKNEKLYESELESLLIANLRDTLLELGKGYAFVGRQYHIHTQANEYYVDLVFYNYILSCFVLIDLKTERITHQDVGQMDMYVRMFDELVKSDRDNPTLGIVLCAETDEDIAKYSILKGNEQLFATKYKLYLPTEEELRAEIEHQKELYYLQHSDQK